MQTLKMRARPDTMTLRKRPKAARDIIPVDKVWEDGMFRVGKNRFSQTWSFSDINYQVLGMEKKRAASANWQQVLNGLDSAADVKITVINKNIDLKKFQEETEIAPAEDGLNWMRDIYNAVLRQKIDESDGIEQERYLTFSCIARSEREARSFFSRTHANLIQSFAPLKSEVCQLDAEARLRIFHSFFCPGYESAYELNMADLMRRGQHFKDYIAPPSFKDNLDYFRMGDKFARVLRIKSFPAYLRDTLLLELTNVNRQLVLTIDALPLKNESARREVDRRLMGVETEIASHQRRQIAHNNITGLIPYEMERTRKNMIAVMDQMDAQNQRLFLVDISMVHVADSLEQLNDDTDYLISVAANYSFQLSKRPFTQIPDLQGVLPFGVRRYDHTRTLSTAELAGFAPFRVQEVRDKGGIYMGENIVSRNLILVDKNRLANQSQIITGIPGSGKSFLTKEMLLAIVLRFPNDDVLICDPEGEFSDVVREVHGEEIQISANSPHRINAMDVTEGYAEKEGGSPIPDKVNLINAMFEQLCRGGDAVGPAEMSIIERCVRLTFDHDPDPTLVQLREVMLRQPEKEAQRLALYLERFTEGTQRIFSEHTNVDTQNRVVCYNILDLGSQLQVMGLLMICDQILNRVARNWVLGRRTHIIIDEFQVILQDRYAEKFFESAWRRFRKRGGWPTAISQNMRYLQGSAAAQDIVSNSELAVMLNQGASDRPTIRELFGLSDEQMAFVQDVPPGHGLIKYGKTFIPFKNNWPKDNDLYWLMTTKAGEKRGPGIGAGQN